MSDNTVVVEGNWGPTELDTQAESFIKDFATKFNAEEVETEPAEAEIKAAPPQESTVEEPKVEDKAGERGLERLVEREVALRTKEQTLFAREEAVKALESKIKDMEARLVPPDLLSKFEYEPESALKAMGLDPDMIVRQVIANRLGDEAPEQLRGNVERNQMKKELAETRAEMQRMYNQLMAREYVTQVQTGAREFISKGLGESTSPTVAAVAKTNPERVYREIMEEISKDAATVSQRGQGGDVLSYEEAAKRVEARWNDYKSILVPSTPGESKTLEQKSTTAPPKTEVAPNPPTSSVKPPDRPIAPWLQKRDDEEAGIKAALAAYRASETKQG